MGSNILNMYHRPPYRNIGHKVLHPPDESVTSESSCNQNSPEYPKTELSHDDDDDDSEDGKYWDHNESWSDNRKVTVSTRTSPEMSYDENEHVDVHNVTAEDTIYFQNEQDITDEMYEETSLVEGADYDIIQVIAVDPNLLLEASSDEEAEDSESSHSDDDEYINPAEDFRIENPCENDRSNEPQLGLNDLDINCDIPVVSNVDEYFIKDNDEKNILEIKDEPVVQDVDEYFITNTNREKINKSQFNQGIDFRITESNSNNGDVISVVKNQTPLKSEIKDVCIEDLEKLSNIEYIKQFLMDDTQSMKLKGPPRFQNSVSLPQTPMHNICVDIDAKTCLSFEDLDLSDFSFENVKDKFIANTKSFDIPQTLTEEDVNSFLITDKHTKTKLDSDNDADITIQDMEIEKPLETIIKNSDSPEDIKMNIPHRLSASTPLPGSVIDFCLEKSAPINNESSYGISKSPSDIHIQPGYIGKPAFNTLGPDICIEKSVYIKHESDIYNDNNSSALISNMCLDKSHITTESNNAIDSLAQVRPQSIFVKQIPAPNQIDTKVELSDFVDIESCNDTTIPVLKANNLNSLLEQFEASEKFNLNNQRDKKEVKCNISCNLQIHDNKQQMPKVMLSVRSETLPNKSPSPVNEEHDYCSSKKINYGTKTRGGKSLLKPDVLSSNNKILRSRHRTCKDKKIVYNVSSDDETDEKSKTKPIAKIENIKIKKNGARNSKLIDTFKHKTMQKTIVTKDDINKGYSLKNSNGSVMVKNATKASDICSQNNSNSIKLTIRNKSEVIVNNIDNRDNKNNKLLQQHKTNNINENESNQISNSLNNKTDKRQKLDRIDKIKIADEVIINKIESEDIDSNPEDFYNALFTNKTDVQIPQTIKNIEEPSKKIKADDTLKEQPQQKKKKLNLQEYKMRRGVNSGNSSTQVSPEAIFPETTNLQLKNKKVLPTSVSTPLKKENIDEAPKVIFDPIREASRKIIMISKKQKLEALRKKEEEMLKRKIGKVENFELQPLISDSEMMKIIGMALDVLPVPIPSSRVSVPNDYNEIVLVSIGTNTDENIFKSLAKSPERKRKSDSSSHKKPNINFKIKKYDHLLKHNVFDSFKKDNVVEGRDRLHSSEAKIDESRYKDITATLKSVGKQVETKISSNSLFASIQDVIMKKAPITSSEMKDSVDKKNSPKQDVFIEKQNINTKTTIVREYDINAEHGEDKVILHLKKDTAQPEKKSEFCQTETLASCEKQPVPKVTMPKHGNCDSEMSVSNGNNIDEPKKQLSPVRTNLKIAVIKPTMAPVKEVVSKEKTRSNEWQTTQYSHSGSNSRGRRRSFSRHRSRSRDSYRHSYRRRESPYRRKQKSRSPYHVTKRSPSPRMTSRYKKTHSSSRHDSSKDSRTPTNKRQSSTKDTKHYNCNRSTHNIHNKISYMPPVVRKSTNSESSCTSSMSRSSSVSKASASSSSSSSSSKLSPSQQQSGIRNKVFNTYSSEDRENNTPVEERRIVFVGKLEKDLSKGQLRAQFIKFGPVTEVRIHSKEDGSRYGFVTFQFPRDAWSAVEAAASFPQYDVGFGGRRAFCRQRYADLDGLEAKYTESAFHGQAAAPAPRNKDLSYEQLLMDVRNKLKMRKGEMPRDDQSSA